MAADANTGMPKVQMKQLLAHSKADPLACAIGLGDNAQLGLLMLNRTKTGLACQKLLQDSFPQAKNLRWGTAFVDVDDNPKLVKFILNKPVTGMARKLVNTLKGTGFTKVMIVLEDGSHVETIDGEAAQTDAQTDAQAATQTETLAEAAPAVPPAPPVSPAPTAPQDAAARSAALQKRLAALAPGIPKAAGDDAGRKAVLLKMAGEANVNIKTNNLVYAANMLDQLEREMGATPAQPTAQVFTTSRTAWAGTRQKIEADLERLRAELAKTYVGEPYAAEIDTQFRTTIAPVLRTFDDRLLTLMDQLGANPANSAPIISEARATMKSYLTYAASEPLIAELDANPFVPLTIRNTVTTTLAALAKALH